MWSVRFVQIVILYTLLISIRGQLSIDCGNAVPVGYDRSKSPKGQTEVFLTYQIEWIEEVNAKSRSFSLPINIQTSWEDHRVFQNASQNQEEKSIHHRDLECFWIPEVSIESLVKGALKKGPFKKSTLQLVPKTKSLILIQHYNLVARCPMMFQWYPLDVQLCHIHFIQSKNTSLDWAKKFLQDSKHLDTAYHLRRIRQLGPTEIEFGSQKLTLEFKFARSPFVALVTLYFPSALIVCVSFVSFWIDSQAVPGRVTLVVMSLLTLMTQLISVRNGIPDVSYVTAIDVWFFACITFVAFSLFEFAISYTRSTQKSGLLTPVVYNPSFKRRETLKMIKTKNWPESMITLRDRMAKINSREVDIVSRYTFPVTFTMFAAIYWATFVIAKNKSILE